MIFARIVIAIVSLGLTQSAIAQATISATPSHAPAEAAILVQSTGLSSGSADFWLNDGMTDAHLVTVDTVRGSATATAIVPNLAAGSYDLEVRQRDAVEASIPFVIDSAIPLQISPVEGPPGIWISMSASGLAGDTVTVRYGNLLVYGPAPLRSSDLSIEFEVPQSTSPGNQQILLRTLRGRSTINLATASFNELPPVPLDPPRVENVQIVYDAENERFVGTGELIPRSQESLADYEISMVFRANDGTVLPVQGNFTANPFTNTFEFSMHTPHLVNGDAIYAPGYAGDVEIAIVLPERADNGGPEETSVVIMLGTLAFPDELTEPLTIRIEDLMGQPLEDVFIQVQSRVPMSFEHGTPGGDGLHAQSLFVTNASGDYSGPLDAVQDWPIQSCGYLLYKGLTNETGEVMIQFDPAELQSFAIANFNASCQFYDPQQPSFTCDGQLLRQVDIPLVLRFDGLFQGYGWNVDGTWVGGAYVMMLRYYPGRGTGEFFGFNYPAGFGDEAIHNPDITEEQLLDFANFTFPIGPDTDIVFRMPEVEPNPFNIYRFGSTLHIDGLMRTRVTQDDYFTGAVSLRSGGQLTSALISAQDPVISFIESGIGGALSNATLFIEGQEIGPFNATAQVQCTDSVIGANSEKYEAAIPAELVYGLDKGDVLSGSVSATAFGGENLLRSFKIKVSEEIPGWINATSDFENREVVWSVAEATLLADEKTRGASIESGNLPYDVGNLENNTSNAGSISQNISGLLGTGDIKRFGVSMNEVGSNTSDPQDYNAPSVPNNGEIKIGPQTTNIIDTGKMPLFRYGWGIWPIASASVGADLWLKADLLYSTTINLMQQYYQMTAEPSATVGLDVFFDVSMILDLVKATATASSSVSIRVPVTVVNGNVTTNEHFSFGLDLLYDVSVGVCPFCLEVGGTECLINAPGSCSAALPQSKSGVISAHTGSPQLAFSDTGFGLASHFTEDGLLQIDEMILGEIDNTHLFPPTPGLMQVRMQFIDRESALAVGTSSALSEQDFLAAPFDSTDSTVTRFQHIVYAEFVDGAWTDFMPLTMPTSGEGSPALATCYDRERTSCPSPRAIAVWVRDMAGDIGAYRSQLYYATYSSGVWSAPMPVDPDLPVDAAVKDGQPAVTYWDNGSTVIPVIAWVRNPAGDIGDLHSRQLMVRRLDGGHMPEQVPGVPPGVASPSMGVDLDGGLALAFTVAPPGRPFLGDQRTLHTARYYCDPSCEWEWREVLDKDGRRIKAERPQVVTDDYATFAITRVLGFQDSNGDPAPLPGDSPGAITGEGDMYPFALHAPDMEIEDVIANPLTFDGQINWEVAASFDPNTGINVTGSIGSPINGDLRPEFNSYREAASKVARVASRKQLGDSSTVLLRVPEGPDFGISNFRLLGDARPGISFNVAMDIINLGAPVGASTGSLDIAFSFDGRDGYVNPVVVETVPIPEPESSHTFTLTLPGGFRADENHSLTASIRRSGRVVEDLNDANNHATLQLGFLTPPGELRVRSSRLDAINHLSWDPVSDDRVIGYRIYRAFANYPPRPIGTSFGTEWADTRNANAGDVSYWVTTFSINGLESAMSPKSGTSPSDERIFSSSFE